MKREKERKDKNENYFCFLLGKALKNSIKSSTVASSTRSHLFLVGSGGQFGLLNQRGRSVHDWEEQFHHSDLVRLGEGLVVEQLLDIADALGLEGLRGFWQGTEGLQQVLVVPWLNFIVAGFWTVDQLFNGVTIVVQDEQVWGQVPSDHGTDFLDSQLQGAVTDKQEDSARLGQFVVSKSSTQSGTDGETNRTPQDLRDTDGVLWEFGGGDTESRGTSFGDDDVAFLQPGGQFGPEPFLVQWDGFWFFSSGVGELDGRHWVSSGIVGLDGGVQSVNPLFVFNNLLEQVLHLDSLPSGSSDLGVVGVEFDNVVGLVAIGEGTGVEVRHQTTNGDDQVSFFNDFLNVWGGQGTNVNTTESWVVFVNGGLTHWGDKGWELGQVNEFFGFSSNVVSAGTSVNKDDWVLSVGDQSEDFIVDFFFGIGVVGWQAQVDWGLRQSGGVDWQVNKVGWQGQVDWLLVDVSVSDGLVDDSWSVLDAVDVVSFNRDFGTHSLENGKVTVTQSVVKQQFLGLRLGRRNTDNVEQTNVFRVSAGNGVQTGQFTDTKGGDHGGKTLDSGVTVSSVTGVQLVGVTGPSKTFDIVDVVEKSQVEVTWNTKDGVDFELS